MTITKNAGVENELFRGISNLINIYFFQIADEDEKDDLLTKPETRGKFAVYLFGIKNV